MRNAKRATASRGVHDDLLGDIPDASVVVYEDESVWRGDVVERGRLLVAEEHVGNPDLFPAEVAQLQLGAVVVALRVERQATVVPLLAQVHAQRKVLRNTTSSTTGWPKKVSHFHESSLNGIKTRH